MIKDKNYKTHIEFNCLDACISNYLNFKGIQTSGLERFFLGDGYQLFFNKESGFQIHNSGVHGTFNALKKMEIPFKIEYIKQNVCESLVEMIYKEQMIIIKVPIGVLDYNNIYNQGNRYATHFINPIGVEGKNLYISDGFVPTKKTDYFQGWVNFEKVVEGWIYKKNYCIILEENPQRHKRLDYGVLEEIVKENIDGFGKGGKIGNDFLGITAIEKFRDEIKDGISNNNRGKEFFLSANYYIRFYGLLSGRKYLAAFLNDLGTEPYVISVINSVIENWEIISILLLKLAYDHKAGSYENLLQRLDMVIELEKKVVKLF